MKKTSAVLVVGAAGETPAVTGTNATFDVPTEFETATIADADGVEMLTPGARC